MLTVEAIYAELEGEWAAAIGADAVDRMRSDVTAAVSATYGGHLPPVRPTW